tara:strand:- start:102 stop:770 length:669 start_codon:yes stop_codon:yes gene_type:complete
MKDYYKILAISKDASYDDIKKSFRKLAQKYHPDKNPDNEEASNKFKEINEAYQILSDKNSRAEYDAHVSGGFRGGDPFGFGFGFGSGLDDIFRDMFGARQQRRDRPRHDNRDVKAVRLEISLDELRSGYANRIFKIKTHNDCVSCNGIGGESRDVCNRCDGRGTIIQSHRSGHTVIRSTMPCNACSGRGTMIKNPCTSCSGTGVTLGEEIFDVDITCKNRKT